MQARVQGRRKVPYKVEVRISPLSEERCQYAISRCGKKIENLERLLQGEFPEELKELFLGSQGLFPSPKEISFNCSCPDWALICKHVAAVLYGIGARFDENPLLFFKLRGIEVDRFIDVALENRIDSMLKNADKPSERISSSDRGRDCLDCDNRRTTTSVNGRINVLKILCPNHEKNKKKLC